jgi:hypothetical protein
MPLAPKSSCLKQRLSALCRCDLVVKLDTSFKEMRDFADLVQRHQQGEVRDLDSI